MPLDPMTEQQTAATDNALLEKLLRRSPQKFWMPVGNLLNMDGPEAAERIKSLLAEVERLHGLAKANNALARHEAAGRREVEADRQRMREALEEAIIKVENGRTLWVPEWQMWLVDARQALNPASKETNDG